MSIEYTIDIQLTELGFPNILQTQGSSSADPLSPRRPHTSLSKKQKAKRLLSRQQPDAEDPQIDATKRPAHVQETPAVSASSLCNPLQAAQSVEDADADPVDDVTAVSQPTASGEVEATLPPQLTAEQEDGVREDEDDGQRATKDSPEGQLDVDDDSEDSEVSFVYEEEEEDVDDEDVQVEDNGRLHFCLSP